MRHHTNNDIRLYMRLIVLAGTIFAYGAGILLLSIVSLNTPNQRHGSGRLGQVNRSDAFRHREINLTERHPLPWCQPLRYLDGGMKDMTTKPPKLLTALASFPGSGNTWFRYLLQQSTEIHLIVENEEMWERQNTTSVNVLVFIENLLDNPVQLHSEYPPEIITWYCPCSWIYTGSVYEDVDLLESGFPADNIFNSSVLIVKTHKWGPIAWERFGKAILLVRDPDKAIIAEFNRQSGGHVGFASPDRYKRTKGRYWQQFVTEQLCVWEQTNLQWARNFTGEVEIIYYDDLVEDVELVLRQALKFIPFPINEELLNCALSRKEGIYRRKERIMKFDPYTPDMHKAIEEKKREVYAELGRYKV